MKRNIIRFVSVLLAVSLMVCSFVGCQKEQTYEPVESSTKAPEEETTDANTLPENINPLTGAADLSENAIGSRPIAIMVENSPAARPQWGISTPDIVIEGVAEGGITRMMWIYADAEKIPEKVGPVRSARHDYVELAKGLNAIFVHWGGSDGSRVGLTLGYQTIRNLNVDNIDGMEYAGTYFFRDTSRNVSSEHRGCTSQTSIINAISKLGYQTEQTVSDWTPYKVVADNGNQASVNTGSCSEVSVTFSSGYTHTFKYDATENKYYNYLNNRLMTDGNNSAAMAVENVIILYVPVTTLNTSEGHKEWNFEATNGEGLYVSNGTEQKVYWSKTGKSAPLKIKNADGEELTVNQGQSWIGIVPAGNQSLTKVVE